MAKIDIASQKELRQEITSSMGNLLELLHQTNPTAYYMLGQINTHFDRYCGYAEMLTENQNTKEFQQL